MLVLKSWLKEYINFDWSDEKLSDKLSYSGTLVEDYYPEIDPLVVVAEIRSISKHPNADKLKIAKVFDGNEEFNIVCGANNIKKGQRVPLAKIGAKLAGGEISKVPIRGQESSGMLCSGAELGINENHEGIFILDDEKFIVGKSFSDFIESDTVFDLEITPNRGDCVSHIGVAREISALQNKSLKKEPIELIMSSQNASSAIGLKVNDAKACPRYFARVVKNIKIAESPDWLKQKLVKCGLKPINNVVDVTNYIMLDLGQPMHAFDLTKIKKSGIVVRFARKAEKIKALDGEMYLLKSDDLIIADKDVPIAIAGIIGGYDSQITSETKDIVLEAAEFERRMIRASSKRLGIITDASYRFERGIDPSAIEYAINKAAKMIQELAGGTILSGIVKHEADKETNFVTLDQAKINKLLGTKLSKDEIDSTLRFLGFKVTGSTCQVPSWRHDISIWQDLAEEVARMVGLNNVKLSPVPKNKPSKKSDYYYKEHLKDILISEGYSEVYTYSLLSDDDLVEAQLSAKDLLEIQNPIQPENKYLRSSILPGLLKAIAKNPSFDPVLIFEVADVFNKKIEESKLAVAASGKSSKESIEIVKDKLEGIISGLKVEIHEISRNELSRFKIRKPLTYVFEISLSDISKKMKLKDSELKLKVSDKTVIYRPISKYPSLTRDIAFILDKKVKSNDIKQTIYEISESINRVELFDEFASEKFGKNKKNIAYHIYFQLSDRTMDDAEANNTVKEIIKVIEKKYSAKLRS